MAPPAVSNAAIRDAVEPVASGAGYDLEDVVVTSAGRRSMVRVVVDRDGGVDLDAVAELSREVSRALDDTDVLGEQPYVLEVTSPGVNRPLTLPRHWRRNVGRLVEAGSHTGRIVAADDDGVTLDVDGQQRRFAYDELGDGRIQIEFTRRDGTP
ncbi:MAG TPA: ribosome maturation factor RimP [Mycobacteriales bacterium]|nr:ribosome maturation factor RimP [Mycobacteriales bacterium]